MYNMNIKLGHSNDDKNINQSVVDITMNVLCSTDDTSSYNNRELFIHSTIKEYVDGEFNIFDLSSVVESDKNDYNKSCVPYFGIIHTIASKMNNTIMVVCVDNDNTNVIFDSYTNDYKLLNSDYYENLGFETISTKDSIKLMINPEYNEDIWISYNVASDNLMLIEYGFYVHSINNDIKIIKSHVHDDSGISITCAVYDKLDVTNFINAVVKLKTGEYSVGDTVEYEELDGTFRYYKIVQRTNDIEFIIIDKHDINGSTR